MRRALREDELVHVLEVVDRDDIEGELCPEALEGDSHAQRLVGASQVVRQPT